MEKDVAKPSTGNGFYDVGEGYIHHIAVLEFASDFGGHIQVTEVTDYIPYAERRASVARVVARKAGAVRSGIFKGDMLGSIIVWQDEIFTDERRYGSSPC